jgi:hypothetical protein
VQDGWRKEASGTAAPENHPHAILIEHISWVSDGISAANAILIELWGDGCSDGWMGRRWIGGRRQIVFLGKKTRTWEVLNIESKYT